MNFCVFCGGMLSDLLRCDSCGAVKVGGTWHEPGHGVVAAPVAADDGMTGWRPDPAGRHEGRYFVGGQPTDLIRDGGVEALDSVGKQQLESFDSKPVSFDAPRRGRRRIWLVVASVVLGIALVGGGIGAYLYVHRDTTTVEDRYLTALKLDGFSAEFNSDPNAVAYGRQVCRKLEEGNPQQGMPADHIAVQYFCPQFFDGFHVLETATITGSLTIKVENPSSYAPLVAVDGSACTGANGYDDIALGTPVTVKNGKGEILATTYLEAGSGGRFMCSFPLRFEVTEGQDRYLVSVRNRGEMSYSFDDLRAGGVALVLE